MLRMPPNILRFGLKSAFLKRMPFCLQRITTSATITLMVCAKIVPRTASAGPKLKIPHEQVDECDIETLIPKLAGTTC
mgnify:CR=1 FL=1